MKDSSGATCFDPREKLVQNWEIEELEKFRSQFEKAISQCLKWGFSIEESFGMVWEETLETVEISEAGQAHLYAELIEWAKCPEIARTLR